MRVLKRAGDAERLARLDALVDRYRPKVEAACHESARARVEVYVSAKGATAALARSLARLEAIMSAYHRDYGAVLFGRPRARRRPAVRARQ